MAEVLVERARTACAWQKSGRAFQRARGIRVDHRGPESSRNILFHIRNAACGKKVTLTDATAHRALRCLGINDYFLRISISCPKEGHRRCMRFGR
jgi:hypothetical protein